MVQPDKTFKHDMKKLLHGSQRDSVVLKSDFIKGFIFADYIMKLIIRFD